VPPARSWLQQGTANHLAEATTDFIVKKPVNIVTSGVFIADQCIELIFQQFPFTALLLVRHLAPSQRCPHPKPKPNRLHKFRVTWCMKPFVMGEITRSRAWHRTLFHDVWVYALLVVAGCSTNDLERVRGRTPNRRNRRAIHSAELRKNVQEPWIEGSHDEPIL
jgi:hypothetical protein